MAVVTGQPVATGQPQLLVCNVDGHREWSTGLFECFSDIGSCIMTTCCLPCALCEISSKQGDCACMPFVVQGAQVALRSRVRTLGGIRGSICNDCLVLHFCGGCAVCQMQRELKNMGL